MGTHFIKKGGTGTVGSGFWEINKGYPCFCYINPMSKDKHSLGDMEFAGKIKTQTFKQSQQENLIKAKVMPASKLAETAKRNAKLLLDFEASCIDEERHRRAASPAPKDKLINLPTTRERFED